MTRHDEFSFGLFLTLLVGCSGASFQSAGPSPSGGAATVQTTGGTDDATGGQSDNGGQDATGGIASDGGDSATGGTFSGGDSAIGGTLNTGGQSATGGTLNTGGQSAIGGTFSGGDSATGGTFSGGDSATGGTLNTGGQSATGGKSDGGTSNATGGTSGISYTSMTCDQLTAAYATELQKAKICGTGAATNQCDTTVLDKPSCGCSTFVVSNRTEPLKNLSSIASAYATNNCATACPQIACHVPTSASCQNSTSGAAGQCVDNS